MHVEIERTAEPLDQGHRAGHRTAAPQPGRSNQSLSCQLSVTQINMQFAELRV